MKRALMFSAALILSATAATACPYKDKVQASSADGLPQSTASAEAPAPEQSQAPVEIAEDATAASKTATVAE